MERYKLVSLGKKKAKKNHTRIKLFQLQQWTRLEVAVYLLNLNLK